MWFFSFLFFLPGVVGHCEITFCESCNESQEEAERQVDLPGSNFMFLMAHFNDPLLSHHEGWSNITSILNNGHNGATAHEYEYPSAHRCGFHSCHRNMLLLFLLL